MSLCFRLSLQSQPSLSAALSETGEPYVETVILQHDRDQGVESDHQLLTLGRVYNEVGV